MKSTFKVLFYLKKGSEKKNGEVMIMARISKTSFQKCFLLKAVQRYEDILNMQEFSQKKQSKVSKR